MNGIERIHRSVLRTGSTAIVMSGVLLACGCLSDGSGRGASGPVVVSSDAMHRIPVPDFVARVGDVQPTEDGRLWVLNSLAPYFVLLGPDGRLERQFGDAGGGPEEFGFPVALVRGPDPAEVWTYDVPRNALIRISSEERRELHLPPDTIPPSSLISFRGAGIMSAPPWLQGTPDGFVFGRTRSIDGTFGSALRLWNADVLRVRAEPTGVQVDLRTPIADLLGDPATRYPAATAQLPYPLWTVCPNGSLGLYDPLTRTVRRFTAEGEEQSPLPLPAERRTEMTADRVFDMAYRGTREDVPASQLPDRATFRSQLAGQLDQLVSQSTPVFPEYADLQCTADGTLWLERFDYSTGRLGRGPEWLWLSRTDPGTRSPFRGSSSPCASMTGASGA